MSKLQEKTTALKKEHLALQKMKFINFFLCLRVIFAPLDPDPDCESESAYGSRDPIESGSNPDPDREHWNIRVRPQSLFKAQHSNFKALNAPTCKISFESSRRCTWYDTPCTIFICTNYKSSYSLWVPVRWVPFQELISKSSGKKMVKNQQKTLLEEKCLRKIQYICNRGKKRFYSYFM